MKRIFVSSQSGSDWQRLIAKPNLHWKKGYSAMTSAAAWESASDSLPPELSALLDSANIGRLKHLNLLAAIPEWGTPLPGGAPGSHTDVLSVCTNDTGLCIIAVEAKVNEDFGPLLGAKRASKSKGQAARISDLQELLGHTSLPNDVRYQLLHRTVSALLTARQFHASTAVMLVQSFGSKGSLYTDFLKFCGALGSTSVAPDLYCVPSVPSPVLYLGWCKGDPRFLNTQL